ncbi:MAG: SDR family NAD(P)-dependent oxidoreductase [Myxococcales bacterium]|nr:SDR family NAD(P)-dependent oxidoreductase [Myxococcales bacterium]
MSSTGAFQGLPWSAVYGATKAFDLLLGEALAVELKPAGVDVVTLCPGGTDTEGPMNTGVDPAKVAGSMPVGRSCAPRLRWAAARWSFSRCRRGHRAARRARAVPKAAGRIMARGRPPPPRAPPDVPPPAPSARRRPGGLEPKASAQRRRAPGTPPPPRRPRRPRSRSAPAVQRATDAEPQRAGHQSITSAPARRPALAHHDRPPSARAAASRGLGART